MASVAKRKWTHKGVEKEAWTVRYKDPTGAYRSRQFDRKKEADRYRTQIESEIDSGDHIARSQSATVERAVVEFLEEIDNKAALGVLRKGTAHNYHTAFRRIIIPAFGHRLMLELTGADLEAWYYGIVRAKKMTPGTVYRRLVYLKLLFDFGQRRRWVRKGHNPAADAMTAIGKPRENKIETFRLEDVRNIIAAVDERPFWGRKRPHAASRLAVNLAAFCGLRWGEIHGLTLANIDLAGGFIRIRHTLGRGGELNEPKTKAGNRDIRLPRHIVEMLAEFLALYPTTNPDGIVLASEAGTPVTPGNFRKSQWLPLQKRAGVAATGGGPMRFHALRHFACSWMIENGWPITDVSEMLGHANVAITLQVYAHTVKGRTQSAEAMQSLAEKLLSQAVSRTPVALISDARQTHEIENAEFVEV